MSRFARSRILTAAVGVLAAPMLMAADGAVGRHPEEKPSTILIGFVGGFVRHDNPNHGPVFLARHLQQGSPKDAYIQVFENRHRRTAYKTILRLLDHNHDGALSNEEKAQARIILFGQSWGGSAVVMLARDLNRAGIPVLLTVQVDSVAKPFEQDGVIPGNVAAAANFYQPRGFVHGRAVIRAADGSKTQILGNYLFDYKNTPAKCEGMPWWERTFIPGHMHTECDSNLWRQVEGLVRQRLEPETGNVAALPKP